LTTFVSGAGSRPTFVSSAGSRPTFVSGAGPRPTFVSDAGCRPTFVLGAGARAVSQLFKFSEKSYNYKDTLHKARGIFSSPRSFSIKKSILQCVIYIYEIYPGFRKKGS
jgi:hypothetical protein